MEVELPTTNGLGGVFFVPGRPELIEGGIVGHDWARRLALWDLTTQRIKAVVMLGTLGGQPFALLTGHEAWVTSLSFSPSGEQLASASVDHSIRIWDVTSRKEWRRLQGHENEVYSVQFAPDGRLYSVGRDGLVCAWSLASLPRLSGRFDENFGADTTLVFAGDLTWTTDGAGSASPSRLRPIKPTTCRPPLGHTNSTG